MTNGSFLDRLRSFDSRILFIVSAFVTALAPVAPRATVPALFVLFAYQVTWMLRNRSLPRINIPVAIGLAALVLWAYLSTLWALAPTGIATTRLVPLFIAALCLMAWTVECAGERIYVRDLCVGVAVAAVIYVFEFISWGWLTRTLHGFEWRDIIDDEAGGIAVMSFFINGTAILSLFMWPAVTGLLARGRRVQAAFLVGVIVVLIVVFGSESGLIAVVLGWLVWWSVAKAGRTTLRVLSLLFVVVVLATPFVFTRVLTTETIDRTIAEVPQAPHSALVRLMIWKFTSERIAERPWIGWGFDTARRIPDGGEKFVLRTRDGRVVTSDLNLPLHPHNQILQIWLELGAVGAVIVALTGAALIRQTGNLTPVARNGSAALIVSVLVFDALSYGAWQSWWIAAVALAAAAQASMNRSIRPA